MLPDALAFQKQWPVSSAQSKKKEARLKAAADVWHQLCWEECLCRMQKNVYAYVFQNPVLEAPPHEVPDVIKQHYRESIKQPMDYSTISKKLCEREYPHPEEFASDMLLIYDNCMLFNPDNGESKWLHQAAKKNKEQFFKLWNRVKQKVMQTFVGTNKQKHGGSKKNAPIKETSSGAVVTPALDTLYTHNTSVTAQSEALLPLTQNEALSDPLVVLPIVQAPLSDYLDSFQTSQGSTASAKDKNVRDSSTECLHPSLDNTTWTANRLESFSASPNIPNSALYLSSTKFPPTETHPYDYTGGVDVANATCSSLGVSEDLLQAPVTPPLDALQTSLVDASTATFITQRTFKEAPILSKQETFNQDAEHCFDGEQLGSDLLVHEPNVSIPYNTTESLHVVPKNDFSIRLLMTQETANASIHETCSSVASSGLSRKKHTVKKWNEKHLYMEPNENSKAFVDDEAEALWFGFLAGSREEKKKRKKDEKKKKKKKKESLTGSGSILLPQRKPSYVCERIASSTTSSNALVRPLVVSGSERSFRINIDSNVSASHPKWETLPVAKKVELHGERDEREWKAPDRSSILGWKGVDEHLRKKKKLRLKGNDNGSSDEERVHLKEIIAYYKNSMIGRAVAEGSREHQTHKEEPIVGLKEAGSDIDICLKPLEATTDQEDGYEAAECSSMKLMDAPKAHRAPLKIHLLENKWSTKRPTQSEELTDIFTLSSDKHTEGQLSSDRHPFVVDTSVDLLDRSNVKVFTNSCCNEKEDRNTAICTDSTPSVLMVASTANGHVMLERQLQQMYNSIVLSEILSRVEKTNEGDFQHTDDSADRETFIETHVSLEFLSVDLLPQLAYGDIQLFASRLNELAYINLADLPTLPLDSLDYSHSFITYSPSNMNKFTESVVIKGNPLYFFNQNTSLNITKESQNAITQINSTAENMENKDCLLNAKDVWIKIDTEVFPKNTLNSDAKEVFFTEFSIPFDLYYSTFSFVLLPTASRLKQNPLIQLFLLQPLHPNTFEKTRFVTSLLKASTDKFLPSSPSHQNAGIGIISGRTQHKFLLKVHQLYEEAKRLYQADPVFLTNHPERASIYRILHCLNIFFKEDVEPNYHEEQNFLWYVSLAKQHLFLIGLAALPVITLHILHLFSPQMLAVSSVNNGNNHLNIHVFMGNPCNPVDELSKNS